MPHAIDVFIYKRGYRLETRRFANASEPIRLAVDLQPSSVPPSRTEVQAMLAGASLDAVIAALGRPQATQNVAGKLFAYYSGATFDPVSQTPDVDAQFIFDYQGRLELINF